MSVSHLIVIVLLVFSVGCGLLTSFGVLFVRGLFEKFHFMGPAGSVGAVLVATAVVIRAPSFSTSLKAGLVGVLLVVSNSVVTHATARAGRIHQLGDWKPQRGEEIEHEEDSAPPSGPRKKRKSHRASSK